MAARDPLSELLAREAELQPPSAEARERVREGVARTLEGGPPPSPVSDAPPTLPPSGLGTVGLLSIVGGVAVAAGVAVFALSTAGGPSPVPEPGTPPAAAETVDPEPEPEPERPVEPEAVPERPAPRGTEAASEPPVADEKGPEPASDVTPRPKAAPKSKTEAETETEPPAAKGFAEEYALVQSIWKALRRDDPKTAMNRIAAHERDFPKGQLVQEREAARVQALCAQGKEDAAEKAVAAFVAKFPGSSHRAKLERGCAK